jgi:hypothetical protein
MPNEITFGSRVTACDCLLTGRVNTVWTVAASRESAAVRHYFCVQFPPCSPFIDDWAVYRHGEIALLIEHPKLTNVNVVNLMRPKFPRFQT